MSVWRARSTPGLPRAARRDDCGPAEGARFVAAKETLEEVP
jgi:hypothetical protein